MNLMRLQLVLSSLLLLAVPSVGLAAYDVFLKVKGVEGEAADAPHKNWIAVVTVSNDVAATTVGSGARVRGLLDSPLVLVKELDRSSPCLARACGTGQSYAEMTLQFCDLNSKGFVFYDVDLQEVTIKSLEQNGATLGPNGRPTEQLRLSYGKSTWTYSRVPKSNGSPPQQVVLFWDIPHNAGGILPSATDPVVVTHPQDQVQYVGSAACFEVLAAGALPLKYQWQFNGTDLPDATDSTLTVTNLIVENSGVYAVCVANDYGSLISANARLKVKLFPMTLGTLKDTAVSAPIAKLLASGSPHAIHPLKLAGVDASSTNGGPVTASNGVITYAPPPGYVGPDAFNYTVSDGQDAYAIGDVFVTVASKNNPSLTIVSTQVTPNSRVIVFAGIPGRLYVVQSAPTLEGPWSDLGLPMAADSTGLVTFTDKSQPQPPLEFYRVRAASNP